MNHEGVALIARAVLVLAMIVTAAASRAYAAPGRRGHAFMLAGTLVGITSGVAVAPLISRFAGTDVSALTASFGVMTGWVVAAVSSRRAVRPAVP